MTVGNVDRRALPGTPLFPAVTVPAAATSQATTSQAAPAPLDSFTPAVPPAPSAAAGSANAPAAPAHVRLPLQNFSGYPFSAEGYNISTAEVDGSRARYPGKISEVYYGFTPATKADYEANNDVPWFDAQGNAVAAGVFRPVHHHDGGYKGSFVMDPLEVDVPAGMNLVYKIGFDKFGGLPYVDGDTRYEGHAETKTYFVDVTGK